MHKVLVNRLGGLSLPRKSVVRLTDRPDMTLDVYHGRKTTMQPTNSSSACLYKCKGVLIPYLVLQQMYPSVSVLGLCQLPSSGPSCSKLTMLLGKFSLKFQMLISEIRQYFWLKKCEKTSLPYSDCCSEPFSYAAIHLDCTCSLVIELLNLIPDRSQPGFGYKVVKH